MGRARGHQHSAVAARRRSGAASYGALPTRVVAVEEYLREEQSPNFDWDVGDLVWLGSGAESDDLNDERWHKVKAHDPLGSAFTLPYLQSVERLPSGLYRVTFVESQGNTYFAPRPRFAIVDVARCAVSLTPNTPHAYSHAALYAALGYHALHETAEPTVYSRDLAATWYWFEETGEAISSARLLALAAAAIQVLRLRGGSVEINPEDLLLLSAPTDAPSPESVTRLVGGDNSAYAQVWNEYLTLLKESSLTLTSESPEFDLEQLWRYENALAVYDVARSVREIESARVVLYQNLLNTHPPALSDERLSVVAGETAETLQNEIGLAVRDGKEASTTFNNHTSAWIDVAQAVREDLGNAISADPQALERILPAATRHALAAAFPNHRYSFQQALALAVENGCFQYLQECAFSREVRWTRVQELTAQELARLLRDDQEEYSQSDY